ncbi:small ubiquitin-related modifier 2-like [Lynx rufus]|uniref:small ubiquitin-related modifier 2-like n=1 Tax=Lynx rufus TaxID=61384 RepID=UPI001F126BB2|nr:small ubiquitin-related modifier 2-like [Lynx rufus]
MADEKPMEGVKSGNNDHVHSKVVGQDGSVVLFKIKRNSAFSKLMKACCEQRLDMEHKDIIDVFLLQTGGVYEKMESATLFQNSSSRPRVALASLASAVAVNPLWKNTGIALLKVRTLPMHTTLKSNNISDFHTTQKQI